MRKINLLIFVCFIIFISFALAQENKLEVNQMDFCEKIEAGKPVGISTIFADTISSVYCFTVMAEVEDSVAISHIWYHNDMEISELELMVKPDSLAIWSSKAMMEEWTGTWRVDVVAPDGKILMSKEFMLQATMEGY